MRDLHLPVQPGPEPKYLRLAEAVRRAVEGGQLQAGDLLPSTRQLAERWETHRHTVMNALAELVAEGWLESEPGRGYRVVAGLPRYFVQEPPPTSAVSVAREARLTFSFPGGQPDLRLFPTQEYYAILREVMRRYDPQVLLGYDRCEGAPELRLQLSHYLRRLRDIIGHEVVVTQGSQEGLFLLAKMLIQPGDVVAVEELGYPPAWGAFRLAGGNLVGLPVDRHGVDPEALDRLARRSRVAMLYTTPLHQYPTTVTMPLERRRELYEVAVRHGIPLLEDDYDHEFHFRSRPLAPLRSRDPEGLVYYISSFSKVVYPSARLGFVVLPPGRAGDLVDLKRFVTRQSNTLIQLAQARWMEKGGFERHLRRMRRVYQSRMTWMSRRLDEGRARWGLPLQFELPDGGMSLWVDFGVDSRTLAERARALGVLVQGGHEYHLHGKASTYLRLGFASSQEQEMEQGLSRLFEAAGAR